VKAAFRYPFWTAFYVGLVLAIHAIPDIQVSLGSFDWNQIGEATLKRIDIESRIAGFQQYFLWFAAGMLAVMLGARWTLFALAPRENPPIRALSFAGSILLISAIWNPSYLYPGLLPAAWILVLFVRSKVQRHQPLSVYALLMSIFGSLLIWMLAQWWLPNAWTAMTQYMLLSVTFALLLFSLHAISARERWLQAMAALFPLAMMPLVVGEVKYMLLRHWGLTTSPDFLALFLLVACGGWAYYRWRKPSSKGLNTVLMRSGMWLSAGSILHLGYMPTGQAPTEMYEMANRVLPLMEWHYFRTLPLLEKVSSHFVSDYGFGLMYQFLYGYQGLDFLIFDVFEWLVFAVVAFVLLRELTGSMLAALFFVLVFPWTGASFSSYYLPGCIPLVLLLQLVKHPSPRNYGLFALVSVAMIPWRADLSVAFLPPLIVLCFILAMQGMLRWKPLLISLGASALGMGILCWGICVAAGIDWMANLKAILDYLMSSQSYGLVAMGDAESSPWKLHHLIMPLLAVASALWSLMQFWQAGKNRKAFYAITFFTAVFAWMNLPRGLVRHGFAEGMDNFLLSISMLSFPVAFLSQYRISSFQRTVIWTLWIVVFSIWMRYPVRVPEVSPMVQIFEHPLKGKDLHYHAKQARLQPDTAFIQQHISGIRKELLPMLGEGETFFDFSNTPMLYYYLEKEVPSFFFQNPQNVHSMTLQEDWVRRMPEFKVPIVLFRHDPPNWWDATDGVPNTLRHAIMSRYLQRHYRFDRKAAGYEIWISSQR
jgi:hypothetical protein